MTQRPAPASYRKRQSNPTRNPLRKVECLEPRLLLYATNAGVWPHPELITVSFMPDGASIGGAPSALFAKMNSKWSTATWQKTMLQGLQNWAANSNLNFSVVTDDGSAFGSAGASGTDNNVEGDQNFGDFRIGGFNLGSNLGIGMLPPPVNGDTTAGDFFLNTNATTTWNMGSSYDLLTVSTHEVGHALGLDHSSMSKAEMYSTYSTVKSTLTSDDISGIQSKYGARSNDSFDATASNGGTSSATVITSFIDSNKQISLSNLDITATSDVDYYKLTIPSGAASSMTIKMQASGLSLLAPKLELYNSSGKLISGKSVSGGYNSTVTLTQPVSAGQVYYIKAMGADTTVFGTGRYALQVNMGTATQPAVASPNTATAASGTGGTSSAYSTSTSGSISAALQWLLDLISKGYAEGYSAGDQTGSSLNRTAVLPTPERNEFHTVETVSANQGLEHLWSQLDGQLCGRSDGGDADHSHTGGGSFNDAALRIHGNVSGHASHQQGATGQGHAPAAHAVDHVAESDPVDVIRPGFALVCELAAL